MIRAVYKALKKTKRIYSWRLGGASGATVVFVQDNTHWKCLFLNLHILAVGMGAHTG